RNDRLFDVVPVQITEHHVEAAVGDAFPSLVDGNDALAGVEADVQLGRLRLRGERQRHQGRCAQRADKRREPPLHCCWLLVVVLALLRASSAALYSSSLKSYQLIHAKPISSIVRLPLPTQLRGSGLILLAELSCQLITCSTVPAG